MVTELLIVGCGGLAKEAAQLARRIDPAGQIWSQISYVSEDKTMHGCVMPFGRVEYSDADLEQYDKPVDVVIGVGHPLVRRKLASRLVLNPCFQFPNLVHPNVEIDEHWVRLGRGNMVTLGTVLTCDIQIGDFNLFNWNCTIGHDVSIGSFNVINPSASVSGQVGIGDTCLIGTGARIIENLKLCSETTIGAGAVVSRSTTKPGIYVGVPARLKKT